MIDPKAAQKRLFDRVVTQQLDKLEAAARGANADDQVDESRRELLLCMFALEQVLQGALLPLFAHGFLGGYITKPVGNS